MKFPIAALCGLLTLALAACSTARGTREPVWPWPEPPNAPGGGYPEQPPPSPQPGVPTPLPPAQPQASYPRSAAEISGPAVLALLNQAQTQRDANQPGAAAAALERALRIEPRNPFVWQKLAEVQLDQGDYDEAETVAARANTFARGNPYIEAQNWRLIATARERRGDISGAVAARSRAEEIARATPQG